MRISTLALLGIVSFGCTSTGGPIDDDDTPGDDDDAANDDDDAVDDDDDAPVDEDGDGYPEGVDCDDQDPDLHPGIVPELSLVDPGLSFFWNGRAAETAAVPVQVTLAGCSDISVESDVAWLAPSWVGSFVTVLVDGAAVRGGVHVGRVTLRHDYSGAELAEFPVELRALGGPDGARKVLVVGLDGVRGDSLDPAATPAMDALRSHAAWTTQATTQLEAPTVSGPGWTSILTGVDSDKHGISGNSGMSEHDPAYPTFLSRLRTAGLATSAWTSWDPVFNEIIEVDATDDGGVGSDESVTEAMDAAIRSGGYDAHFIHLDNVDHEGHSGGFTPVRQGYLDTISEVDGRIAVLLDAILGRTTVADEEWLVVVTSDHGGLDTNHGSLNWECRTIPLIAAGPSVQPGTPARTVSHLDVAPTVLDFLGVPIDPGWDLDGEVVGAPFEEDCGDGLDDDGDGDIDCDDADCVGAFSCACPEEILAASQGFALATGSTVGQGDDVAGSCGGAGGADRTFAWTAPSTGTWTFDLTGSDRNFDTVLYALDGCEGAEAACNDDATGSQSALSLDVTAGDELVFVVDGAGGGGSFRFNAEPLSACPDVDAASAVGAAIAGGSNLQQGGSFFASCARSGRDALVAWTAPATGTFTFDTDGSDYDTVLHLRDGNCSGPELACSDDDLPGYLSSLTVELTQGQEITVVVSGFNGRPEGPGALPTGGGGNWVLNVAGP